MDKHLYWIDFVDVAENRPFSAVLLAPSPIDAAQYMSENHPNPIHIEVIAEVFHA